MTFSKRYLYFLTVLVEICSCFTVSQIDVHGAISSLILVCIAVSIFLLPHLPVFSRLALIPAIALILIISHSN